MDSKLAILGKLGYIKANSRAPSVLSENGKRKSTFEKKFASHQRRMEETPLSFKVEFKGEGDETVEIKVSLPGMTEVPEIQDISEIQEISDIQEGQESKASSNEESEEDTEEGQQDRKDEDEKDDKGEDVAAGEEEQFSDEDLQQMMELSLLSPAAMIAHIQGLEARMFELSQREARELNRSKHLRIFGNSRRRASK